MPKIADLLAEEAKTTVRFGRATFEITYRPGAWSGPFLDGLGERSLYEVVCHLVSAWDLQDNEGNVIPLEPAAIEAAEVPLPALQLIYERIREVILPNLRSATDSAST